MRKGLMLICSAQVSTLVILVSVHTISVLVGEESVAVGVVVCSAAEPVVVFFFVLVLKRRVVKLLPDLCPKCGTPLYLQSCI